MERGHYTYMLRCADGTIYTGYAVDPEARLDVHNSGKGAKYTRARRPVELVYYEIFDNKGDALRREIELKKISRKEKEQLIDNFENSK